MKFVFASDSFKGSLTSEKINEILQKTAKRYFPSCDCIPFLTADGGEGTLEAVIAQKGGNILQVQVENAVGKPIFARYGTFDDCAIVCMSEASGLPQLSASEQSAKATSTYGTGQLIKHAIESGYKRIFVTLGGSATNDGGTGALSALGYRFLDKNGNALKGFGENLINICTVDDTQAIDTNDIEMTLLCDVSNPLLGENGATYTYGKQKGASEQDLAFLERGMTHFAQVAQVYCGKSINESGCGAAGGLGAGLYGFLNAKIRSGIQTILDLCHFDEALKDADFVFTGEGRLDGQSVNGKVIDGVLSRAKAHNVPVIAIAGSIGDGAEKLYEKGLAAAFAIVDRPMNLETAIAQAEALYQETAENVFRLLKASKKE